jgi:hypothetical protein
MPHFEVKFLPSDLRLVQAEILRRLMNMNTRPTEEKIVQHALELLERSYKLIALARTTALLDERCFEGTRKAIARSRKRLYKTNHGKSH